MRKIILLLLLVPLLNNCTQYTAMVGPSLTFAHTGSVLQASTSLSSSLAVNKIKNDYKNELKVEKICPTVHSSELNEIFFETIEHMDCYFDPLSILR
tara:strand:- start:51 stop:341 length:291 start_codon:yes stop_codon:yes gene_type:complete